MRDQVEPRVRRFLNRKRAEFLMRLRFLSQFLYIRNQRPARFRVDWGDRWPCYRDSAAYTDFDRHYVFHTAWASRVLAETAPKKHIDVSSSLYFVANTSAFIPMKFYDYRPAPLQLSNLDCHQGDLLKLPFNTASVNSLSCMHVLEHVGLGRYGEPLNYDGDLKAVAELQRVMQPGGQLLLVVPIGGEARIQFNAHRIYTYKQVVGMFPSLVLSEFSLIQDDERGGGLIRNADFRLADQQGYGCGCFHFRCPSP